MPDLLSSDLLQSLSFLVDIFLKYLAILDWPFSFMTKALKTLFARRLLAAQVCWEWYPYIYISLMAIIANLI